MSFKKVAVIGAGTMGAGIAGQVANAGVAVLLLDLKSQDGSPNVLAERGFRRLLHPNQPGFMDDSAKSRVTLGNITDDLHLLADCDWVAEAVVERLDVKRALYQQLDGICSENTIITSNTSTIPIHLLVKGMSENFQRRFAVTHFFNPVRFMRLLELVSGAHTSPAVMDTLDAFCEQRLGKGVVRCRDTPGFLGNRVGVFAIQCALHEAFNFDLTPPQADALFGRPMGIPKTGVFGLYDLIGIDLMSDVVKSLVDILPDTDAFHGVSAGIPVVQRMIAEGRTGNKSGRGFYWRSEQGAGADGESRVMNLHTGEYADFVRVPMDIAGRAEREGVGVLLEDDSRYGEYAWAVLSRTLCYAASLVPEVADDPLAIDDAMKLGYNWLKGPFELLDEIGVDAFIARLQTQGRDVPAFLASASGGCFYVAGDDLQVRDICGAFRPIVRARGVVRFSERRRMLRAENSNAAASWFIDQDVAVVEFHSKANALDAHAMSILSDAVEAVPGRNLQGLLVHNDAQHFSCGVNLGVVRGFFERDDMDGLDRFLDDFQKTVMKMRDAGFPVVVAPVGLSLGGGFEVVLHGRQVVAHANSVMGLVESLVGVVPSGGGCKEMLYRWIEKLDCRKDVSKASWKAFMNTGYGKTATSPILAKDLAMMRDNDRFEMNRDRIYQTGINAIHSAKDQKAFQREPVAMPGAPVFEAMEQWLANAHAEGGLTRHDVVVGKEIARIMSGGETVPGTVWSEQDLLDAERRSFLALASSEATQQRIIGMLDEGRTVRN